MTTTPGPRPHALAETAAAYGASKVAKAHTKLSISIPSDLADQVRLAAADSGLSISGVIAAALQRAVAGSDQDRLDAAIDAQNQENVAWADAFLPLTARLWAEVEW
jgi:post-segregation antitoxin (ccd killing protein)